MHIPSKVKLKWQPCKNLTFFFTFQNCFWCPRIIMSQHAYHKNHNSTRLTQCAESCEVCNKKLIIKNWPQSLFEAMHVSTNTKRYMLPWTVKLSNLSCWSFKTKKTKVFTRYGRKYDDGQKCFIWYTGSFHIIIKNPAQDIIQCLTWCKKHQKLLLWL